MQVLQENKNWTLLLRGNNTITDTLRDMHLTVFPCGQIRTPLVKQTVHFKNQLKLKLDRLPFKDKTSTSCQTKYHKIAINSFALKSLQHAPIDIVSMLNSILEWGKYFGVDVSNLMTF